LTGGSQSVLEAVSVIIEAEHFTVGLPSCRMGPPVNHSLVSGSILLTREDTIRRRPMVKEADAKDSDVEDDGPRWRGMWKEERRQMRWMLKVFSDE